MHIVTLMKKNISSNIAFHRWNSLPI